MLKVKKNHVFWGILCLCDLISLTFQNGSFAKYAYKTGYLNGLSLFGWSGLRWGISYVSMGDRGAQTPLSNLFWVSFLCSPVLGVFDSFIRSSFVLPFILFKSNLFIKICV